MSNKKKERNLSLPYGIPRYYDIACVELRHVLQETGDEYCKDLPCR